VQGDLTVSEYCRKLNNMADALADLGSPVDNLWTKGSHEIFFQKKCTKHTKNNKQMEQ
jgi:uncharacterized protein YoxC